MCVFALVLVLKIWSTADPGHLGLLPAFFMIFFSCSLFHVYVLMEELKGKRAQDSDIDVLKNYDCY